MLLKATTGKFLAFFNPIANAPCRSPQVAHVDFIIDCRCRNADERLFPSSVLLPQHHLLSGNL